MPIHVEQLLEQTRAVTGTYDNQGWTVRYFPHKIDDRMMALLASFRTDPGFESLNLALTVLIDDWDLILGSQGRLPITLEWLAKLPVDLKLQMANEILDDWKNPKSTSGSSNSSSQRESSEPAPGGILSSVPQNISEFHPGPLLGPITQPGTPPGSTGPS